MMHRPIFRFAPAARMNRDTKFLPVAAPEMLDRFAIRFGWKNPRGGIGERQAESREWTRQLTGGVIAVVELAHSREKIRCAGLSDVRFEDFVRIVEVTQDKIEAGKIRDKVGRQLGVLREEFRQRRRFDGADFIRVETLLRQRGDMFGPENFEVRARKAVAQQFYRRQREDEIADGAAANDQDTLQVSNA